MGWSMRIGQARYEHRSSGKPEFTRLLGISSTSPLVPANEPEVVHLAHTLFALYLELNRVANSLVLPNDRNSTVDFLSTPFLASAVRLISARAAAYEQRFHLANCLRNIKSVRDSEFARICHNKIEDVITL